jgi:1,4-alpha-glucan branching enzyme
MAVRRGKGKIGSRNPATGGGETAAPRKRVRTPAADAAEAARLTDELKEHAEQEPTMAIEPVAGTESASPAADLVDPAVVREQTLERTTRRTVKTEPAPLPVKSKRARKSPDPEVAPPSRGVAKPRRTSRRRGSSDSAERIESAGSDITTELQSVGADIVPAVPIRVDVPATEAREPEATAPHTEPAAIREHTIDQIEPEVEARSSGPLTDWDLHLFNEGTHHKLWEKLGSHPVEGGVTFGVWAPNAQRVSVVGDFNGWDRNAHPLSARGDSGIWEGFIPGLGKGAVYKYHIVSRWNDYSVDKADPMAVLHETPPRTASVVWDLDYQWNDDEWMRARHERNATSAPMSVYEVHLGSWRRVPDDHGRTWRSMNYREIAKPLAEYVKKMNFTHIELLPIMEHPFYGSWGYQCTGFFAPTSRHGTPQDFKYLVDVLHQHGIGVILDWVPSHFPTDEHGLSYFDGTHLYEHEDPRKGFHPDWNSLIFNYDRNEVRSFLLSSALYWVGEYHADGLRVDAVASMLYLDYSRQAGEWIPNEFGGRENIDAISFLRRLNEDVYKVHPDVQVIAEESTAWPMVSRPTYVGGLGFGLKWDMGWMHDTLRYFAKDPVHRKFHHNDLTFRMMYAFTENFVLPLSHDEVVHGKGSLLGKMPGDEWQRAANLRLLFADMYANPGKKLLFMGGDIGQWREWNHDSSLDWVLLEHPLHAGINRWLEDLNKAYRDVPALHELDVSPAGFEWIDCCDTENSIVSLMRRGADAEDTVVVVMNFTPLPRHNYQIGVPQGGRWIEILNSDAPLYGGSGQGNMGGVEAAPIPLHGRRWSVNLTLPPLGAVFLRRDRDGADFAAGELAPPD